MPPPPPDTNQTVIMSNHDAIAAAAAFVVDASVTFQGSSTSRTQMLNTSNGLVTDPISYSSDYEDSGMIEPI